MTEHVVGVDGGGTRTRAVILDAGGVEVGRAEGRAAVASAQDPGAPARAVAETVREAAEAAGVEPPVRALWAALSGAGREEPRSAVEVELGRLDLAGAVRVGADVHAAFHDAFGAGPGILLIAGTGSIAWGRAEDGREGRVGGWGHHIGDEGSGYAIGLEALRRVARHVDGRAPETVLLDAVLEHLEADRVEEVVPWAHDASKGEIAALARAVVRASREGDAVAGEIVAEAVEELEGHVLTILQRLGPWEEPPGLALAGGLLRPGGSLREIVTRVLAKHQITPLDRALDPAMGAARLALDLVD